MRAYRRGAVRGGDVCSLQKGYGGKAHPQQDVGEANAVKKPVHGKIADRNAQRESSCSERTPKQAIGCDR